MLLASETCMVSPIGEQVLPVPLCALVAETMNVSYPSLKAAAALAFSTVSLWLEEPVTLTGFEHVSGELKEEVDLLPFLYSKMKDRS